MVVAGVVAAVSGCTVGRTPETIRQVENDDFSPQHPACFKTKGANVPKAFLVKNQQAWATLWGQGEEPPVINFDKAMVFVAFASIGSEGPGSMSVWVLKYYNTKDILEVRVRESLSGTWPLSSAYSRAYHIVSLPKADKPVKVVWRRLWGKRDETTEIEATQWTPRAQTPMGAGAGAPQGGWGGRPPQQAPQQGRWGGQPSRQRVPQQGGWGGAPR